MPTTTEICSFVKTAVYFRRLIKGYAELLEPLIKLPGGNKNEFVNLIKEAIEFFKKIRDVTTTFPVVFVFDWQK
ncbi:hypothetical protein GcC1_011001 [Golovinomyces cichoracearum]|uniref:Uncharacterized protein n=1 Tax=Golovinomyces cichoracearum TaxID=62708 RepID=A0A420J7F9_9PEZI|nr:hypothetical protein GcC1_011001 [Golovinomyces cichoracearum]